jgi:hypothetical protein
MQMTIDIFALVEMEAILHARSGNTAHEFRRSPSVGVNAEITIDAAGPHRWSLGF